VDVYVIATQETTQFDTKETEVDKIPRQDENISKQWSQELHRALNVARGPREELQSLAVEQFGSIMLIVFIRKSLALSSPHVDIGRWVTRSNTLSGIKGAVAFSFRYLEMSYCVVSSHLEANTEFYQVRVDEFQKLISLPGFEEQSTKRILDHDYVVWLGDLNMRIDSLLRTDVLHSVDRSDWTLLLNHDQLKRAQREGVAFKNFYEGIITFAPSYKFNPDSDLYDTSHKARAPAWCDRVLWSCTGSDSTTHLSCAYYNCIKELRMSDHKPVVGVLVSSL
jgi:hypothetical protein